MRVRKWIGHESSEARQFGEMRLMISVEAVL